MREVGHLFRAAREDLDVFRTLSGPLHRSDEGQAPGPAAALQHLHHIPSEKNQRVHKIILVVIKETGNCGLKMQRCLWGKNVSISCFEEELKQFIH